MSHLSPLSTLIQLPGSDATDSRSPKPMIMAYSQPNYFGHCPFQRLLQINVWVLDLHLEFILHGDRPYGLLVGSWTTQFIMLKPLRQFFGMKHKHVRSMVEVSDFSRESMPAFPLVLDWTQITLDNFFYQPASSKCKLVFPPVPIRIVVSFSSSINVRLITGFVAIINDCDN